MRPHNIQRACGLVDQEGERVITNLDKGLVRAIHLLLDEIDRLEARIDRLEGVSRCCAEMSVALDSAPRDQHAFIERAHEILADVNSIIDLPGEVEKMKKDAP